MVGPAHREVTVQAVDARDMCPWIITLAENDTSGLFNAAGSVFTRAGMCWAIKGSTGKEGVFHRLPHQAGVVKNPPGVDHVKTAEGAHVFPVED